MRHLPKVTLAKAGSGGGVVARIVLLAIGLVTSAVPAPGQVFRTLVDAGEVEIVRGFAVDDTGSVAVAVWSGGFFGSNPERIPQVFKWELPAGLVTQLTSFPEGVGTEVSITDDGEWIVFESTADPLQQNGDGSSELFRMRRDGSELTQLTNDDLLGGGNAYCPRISGTGNRVLFQATFDPDGANPEHGDQLFVLDSGSLAVTRLTTSASGLFRFGLGTDGSSFCGARECQLSISDDGERIVFASNADLTGGNADGSWDVFKIDADGQNLTQLTDDGGVARQISGNGEWVVYDVGGYPEAGETRAVKWDGTGQISLAEGDRPSIDDAGTTVYLTRYGSMKSIPITGGATTNLRRGWRPLVSGGNTHVVYVSNLIPGGINPDEGFEFGVMETTSGWVKQLTISDVGERDTAYEPDISSDGSSVVMIRYPPGLPTGLFHIALDDLTMTRLTTDEEASSPVLTGDGATAVFISPTDLVGGGDCSPEDLFRVQADGTGLQRLTSECGERFNLPAVAANGSVIVFGSTLPGNVFSMPLTGGTMTQITPGSTPYWPNPMVSADGVWATWHQYVGPCSGWCFQIFRGRTDGTFAEQVSSNVLSGYGSGFPDISGDGRYVVYTSFDDPLGANPDQNEEIFLYDAQTGATTQLTETSEGGSTLARITEDGTWVYVLTDGLFFGSREPRLIRIHPGTGSVERVSGTLAVGPNAMFAWTNGHVAIDGDGSRVVFNPACTGDLLLVDYETAGTIRPGKAAPTVVEWDADPRAEHYDLIRGDVALLTHGAGNTVDLGPVACLENDTYNTSNAGADADADQPAPGQAFFFLQRFSPGGDAVSGTYGSSTSGAERVPSAGDCPQ